MWKDYSKSYIKNNRASSMAVMAAAFTATMFLSLLCGLAYNFWAYEVQNIILEEGDWQGRIICEEFNGEDLSIVRQFANVEKAVINKELPAQDGTVVDICFHNARTVYKDMPLIVAQLGLGEDDIQYHQLLLSRYFIHDPEDAEPPMLLALYLSILVIVSVSLILIIRGSFELSMNARIHQFGIFSSIGAAPGQVRNCLLQEAAILSILPIIAGSLLGMLISFGAIEAVNIFAAGVPGRHRAVFNYPPSIFAAAVLVSAFTVLFSAWMPARKLSRMTPLEAIRNTDSLQHVKKRHSWILYALFGMEGELAGNALRARKKFLRISSISLLLSFLGFSIMLCFTTLSDISTRYTYFERYKDAWDVMVTVKNTEISSFHLAKEVQGLAGLREAVIYQKAEAITVLPEELQSDRLISLGGYGKIAGTSKAEGQFQVPAPVIILDDASFLAFCTQAGTEPGLDGAIVLNQIWNSADSNFRYKEYIPFVKEENKTTTLCSARHNAEIPILCYTQAAPLLREEYKDYALVHFVPVTLWKEKLGQTGDAGADTYIRIFSNGNATLDDLDNLEKEAASLVGREYRIESENRVQEQLSNDNLIYGMKMVFGAFCVLLAVIGIANVFSNTLGFIRQRKREFAVYMSVGLTPHEMWKIFCIEAFVMAGKPLLITLPLTVLFVQFAITASYLDPVVFWQEAPVLPVLVFAAAIVLFISLAYYIGGKRLLQCNLNEEIRNDALV